MVLLTTGTIDRHYAHFGRGSGPVFMRNVYCSGSETHLVNCSYSTYSTQYCSHYADIGVECPGKCFLSVHDCVMVLILSSVTCFFLQFPAMTHALPMVTFVLLEGETSMRVEWKSATIDSGGLSVVTCGTVHMLKWPVDSLDTQELVCFTIACYTLCVGSGNCMVRYDYAC